jgi:hypothetical protein
MSSVVFLRAVNVGGHQKFQPSKLAKELERFGVVNLGAAGTFVVRENVSQARLRDETFIAAAANSGSCGSYASYAWRMDWPQPDKKF